MEKIELTIKVCPSEVEMANFCIAQFLNLLKENEKFRKSWDISIEEIEKGENFRKELLDKYFFYGNKGTGNTELSQ